MTPTQPRVIVNRVMARDPHMSRITTLIKSTTTPTLAITTPPTTTSLPSPVSHDPTPTPTPTDRDMMDASMSAFAALEQRIRQQNKDRAREQRDETRDQSDTPTPRPTPTPTVSSAEPSTESDTPPPQNRDYPDASTSLQAMDSQVQDASISAFMKLEQQLKQQKSPPVAHPAIVPPLTKHDIIMTKPIPPEPEECCGNNCANCVWIKYSEALDEYEQWVKTHGQATTGT